MQATSALDLDRTRAAFETWREETYLESRLLLPQYYGYNHRRFNYQRGPTYAEAT